MTNTLGKVYNGRDKKDISKAIYYNCNKKGYFARSYSKPQKD